MKGQGIIVIIIQKADSSFLVAMFLKERRAIYADMVSLRNTLLDRLFFYVFVFRVFPTVRPPTIACF